MGRLPHKKKILIMVKEIMKESHYQKYVKSIMDHNQTLDISRHEIWKKNAAHFQIDKVLEGLQGEITQKTK